MSNGRITTKDLWDLSKSIDEKLDRMVEPLSHRVTVLEVWRAKIMGQVAVIVAVVFFVVDGVKSFVIKKFK